MSTRATVGPVWVLEDRFPVNPCLNVNRVMLQAMAAAQPRCDPLTEYPQGGECCKMCGPGTSNFHLHFYPQRFEIETREREESRLNYSDSRNRLTGINHPKF